MTKFKTIILFCFCCFLLFSCNNKKETKDDPKKVTIETEEGELDVTKLEEAKDQLAVLNFDKAIAKYGEPDEQELIKLNENNIELEELIKKQFPNKEYLTSNVEILEASWKLQEQSWIQVWYKMENKVWIPIDVLLTV